MHTAQRCNAALSLSADGLARQAVLSGDYVKSATSRGLTPQAGHAPRKKGDTAAITDTSARLRSVLATAQTEPHRPLRCEGGSCGRPMWLTVARHLVNRPKSNAAFSSMWPHVGRRWLLKWLPWPDCSAQVPASRIGRAASVPQRPAGSRADRWHHAGRYMGPCRTHAGPSGGFPLALLARRAAALLVWQRLPIP